MSAAYIAASGLTHEAAAADPHDITGVTTPSGSNRLMVLYTCVGSGGPAGAVGVTYNGVAMTHRAGSSLTGDFWNIDCWYMKEADLPASGTVSIDQSGAHDEQLAMITFYDGVDQTTPFRNANATTSSQTASTDPTVTVASDAADLVIGGLWVGGVVAHTAVAGTIRVEDENVAGFESGSVSDISGATPTLTTGLGSSSARAMWVADSLIAATAGATSDQEGARFGIDDGAEAAHSWEAAQDTNITVAAGETRLVNIIVNATGTLGAKAFKLQYRKVGDPDWRDMPVQ